MDSQQDLVSIIIRTNHRKRFELLQKAVDSIRENQYRPVETIIVAQSEDDQFINELKVYTETRIEDTFQVNLVVNKTCQDQRAKNLNLGIKFAKGRYIGFLDDDDVFYSNHISSLVEAIQKSDEIAWAYTNNASVICEWIQSSQTLNIKSIEYEQPQEKIFSLNKLCKNGFIPIHAYLIDREKVSQDLLYFDESLKVLEDYAFMLKLSHSHIPNYLPIITCEYRFYTDASNSNYLINQRLGIDYSEKAKIWWEAYRQVEKLKQHLFPNYRPPFLSFSTRSLIAAKFPFIYRLKPFWHIIKKLYKKTSNKK